MQVLLIDLMLDELLECKEINCATPPSENTIRQARELRDGEIGDWEQVRLVGMRPSLTSLQSTPPTHYYFFSSTTAPHPLHPERTLRTPCAHRRHNHSGAGARVATSS